MISTDIITRSLHVMCLETFLKMSFDLRPVFMDMMILRVRPPHLGYGAAGQQTMISILIKVLPMGILITLMAQVGVKFAILFPQVRRTGVLERH